MVRKSLIVLCALAIAALVLVPTLREFTVWLIENVLTFAFVLFGGGIGGLVVGTLTYNVRQEAWKLGMVLFITVVLSLVIAVVYTAIIIVTQPAGVSLNQAMANSQFLILLNTVEALGGVICARINSAHNATSAAKAKA